VVQTKFEKMMLMAKRDGKRDLNKNDEESPMPKKRANGLRTAIKTHELYLCIKERGNVLSLHRLCH
jgi:hypothetical protein